MRFLVLGPIQVLQDGRTIPIPAGKQRALLAALLVDANRSVPVDTLIERLSQATQAFRSEHMRVGGLPGLDVNAPN